MEFRVIFFGLNIDLYPYVLQNLYFQSLEWKIVHKNALCWTISDEKLLFYETAGVKMGKISKNGSFQMNKFAFRFLHIVPAQKILKSIANEMSFFIFYN